jgi:hypothetical protein
LEQPLGEAVLRELSEYIPESMEPGTVFLLEGEKVFGDPRNPYIAALSCPRCGLIGLITQQQLWCKAYTICGGDICSAEYQIDGENFVYRAPQ